MLQTKKTKMLHFTFYLKYYSLYVLLNRSTNLIDLCLFIVIVRIAFKKKDINLVELEKSQCT